MSFPHKKQWREYETMIWTFKIDLLCGRYAEGEYEFIIEIDSSSTLLDLHLAIQNALEFDDDHLFGFYVSRTERSRDRVMFDDENGEIDAITLEHLYPLEKNKKLFYIFDYGDNWLFKITKSRKKPRDPEKGVKYPRVIEEKGTKPEQYPSYEEEE